MPISTLLLKLFWRIFLALFIDIATIAFAMFSAAMSGGQDALFIASFIVFLSFGWAILPAIRLSKIFSIIILIIWLILAVILTQFGTDSAKGWLIWPWSLATIAIFSLLWINPPSYIQNKIDNITKCSGK